MSWRDGFTAKASYNGAEFLVRASDAKFGRRVQVHEYPLRDKPYAEDLGRKTRKFSLDAFFIGADYLAARDKLITEIEKMGGGELVHPYYGNMNITITDFSVRESTAHGGYGIIKMNFVEAGELIFPAALQNTPAETVTASDAAQQAAIDAFAADFSLSDISDAVDSYLAEVDDMLSSVENVIGTVTGPLADIVRSPAELGSALAGSITNISNLVTEPIRALSIYTRLFSAGGSYSNNNSPRSRQAARNTQLTTNLIRSTALIQFARTTSELELSPSKQGDQPITRNQVLALRDVFLDEADEQQETVNVLTGEPIDDAVFNSLSDLRLAVVTDLSERAGRLPKVNTIKNKATLPALTIAFSLYADASRETEIVYLNAVRHPGFVPGGKELEVLSE